MGNWLRQLGRLRCPKICVSGNWRPREAGDVIQGKSEDMTTREADGVLGSHSPRAREYEMRCSSSNNEAEKKGQIPTSSPFVLFRPSTDWMRSTHSGEGGPFILLRPLIHKPILSRNILKELPSNNV